MNGNGQLKSKGVMTMTATRTRSRPAPAGRAHKRSPKTAAERAEQLSEEVLEQVEAGQRAAIQAVKQFVDTVDRTLPRSGDDPETPSKRQDVVDAAMEMADQLVHTQYDFLRKVVRSAGRSLSGPRGAK